MATIRRLPGYTGPKPWLAQVRIRPFKPTSRSFATKGEATEWAGKQERTLRDQRDRAAAPPAELSKLTLAGLIKTYREDPATKALRTFDDVERLLEWWTTHYGAVRVLDVGPRLLREARDRLRPGRQPATVNRYTAAMRACWRWGVAVELVPSDRPWPSRLMMPEPKERTRYLSETELPAVLKAAADHSPTMRAAVLVSVGCGVRQSELLRLRWGDVDFPSSTLRVLLSKNGESRAVYLPAAVAAALEALKAAPVLGVTVIADAEGQAVTKDWLAYRWKEIRSAAKLKDFRWHDLRHSCASYLAQAGANLLEIGSVLGHKSPSVTKKYAHLVEGAPVTGHSKLNEKLKEL